MNQEKYPFPFSLWEIIDGYFSPVNICMRGNLCVYVDDIHIGNKTENQLSRIQAKKGLGCCCSFDMLITDISSKQQKLCENFFEWQVCR